MTGEGRRKFHMRRHARMKQIRAPWDTIWEAIGDYVLPWEIDFLRTNSSEPRLGFDLIHNSYATDCCDRLANTMMQGITSAARPWFRILPPYIDMMKIRRIREWLFLAEEMVRQIFLRSNIYNVLPVLYLHMAGFGSAVAIIEEDFEDVIRGFSLPIGSFCLGNSYRRSPNTLYYELDMTVESIVERFCLTGGRVDPQKLLNCSEYVRTQWDRGNYNEQARVVLAITPNATHDPQKKRAEFKRWSACFFEPRVDSDGGEDRVLQSSGYDEFPALVVPWAQSGDRAYGQGPGWRALPDVKELQVLKELAANSLDRSVDPTTVLPTDLKMARKQAAPGEALYANVAPGQFVGPLHVPTVDLEKVLIYQSGTKDDIGRAFMTDLILMTQTLNPDAEPRRAREIAERHEEKMLQMGAALERLQEGGLEPLVERTLRIAIRNKLLPQPPEDLARGGWLRLECVSIFHQAQKLLGLQSIDRLSMYVGQLTTVWPDAADTFDADAAVEAYHQGVHAPPSILRDGEERQKIRAARVEQQQQMQAAEAAKAMGPAAKAAKDLSETDVSGDNGLTRLAQAIRPGGPTA